MSWKLGVVLLLALASGQALAEEAQIEVPASDEDFVSLINEVVKKATMLRVKRNNAGLSDLAESNDEKEVDEEMAAAGKSSKSCVATATGCSNKASTCKGPLAACHQALQSCVVAAHECHVGKHAQKKPEADQVEKVSKDEADDSELEEGEQDKGAKLEPTEETAETPKLEEEQEEQEEDGGNSEPEVLDEDYDQAELEKEEHNKRDTTLHTFVHDDAETQKDVEQKAVAPEAAEISQHNSDDAEDSELDSELDTSALLEW